MRQIKFEYSTGYYGMDSEEIKEYSHDVSNWQIAQDAWTGAVKNAEFYGIYPQEPGTIDTRYSDDYPCFVGDNIKGTWKEIV